MGAVTYPNPEVQRFIEQHFIPVQFNVVEQPEVMDQFNTPWTPTLIVQDAEGREHRRSQGNLDPARSLGEMSLAWLRSEEHTSELQSRQYLVCRLLLEKKK